MTYDSNGALIGTSHIANGYVSMSPYTNNYVCINCGTNGLSQISSGVVTGAYPIITASVASYVVSFRNVGSPYYYYERTFQIDDCAPKYEKVNVQYLNRYGAFDCFNFYGNHEKNNKHEKAYYKTISNYFEGSYYLTGSGFVTGANPQTPNRKTLSSTYEQKRILISEYLSDFEIESLQDLIGSPRIIINNDVGDYDIYTNDDLNYHFKPAGEKLQSLQISLSSGITEQRQND